MLAIQGGRFRILMNMSLDVWNVPAVTNVLLASHDGLESIH